MCIVCVLRVYYASECQHKHTNFERKNVLKTQKTAQNERFLLVGWCSLLSLGELASRDKARKSVEKQRKNETFY